jgi:regulator of replication initiation timing
MEKLKQSKVIFDEPSHTYTLSGKVLGGVTPIVAWMFPDTYAGISQKKLNDAASVGNGIHTEIEMWKVLGLEPDSYQGKDCLSLINDNNLDVLASEYLVSDNHDIASCIDLVFGDYSLGDIKTTSQIHYDNVTLQLNIYRVLFERQNKGKKVPHLYVLWCPKRNYGKPQIKELQMFDDDVIDTIIEAYLKGVDSSKLREIIFGNKIVTTTTDVPAKVLQAQQRIVDFETKIASLKEQEENLKNGLKVLMEQNNVKKYELDKIILTYIAPTTRESVDSAKLMEKYPDAYNDCKKVSKLNSSIRIKIK